MVIVVRPSRRQFGAVEQYCVIGCHVHHCSRSNLTSSKSAFPTYAETVVFTTSTLLPRRHLQDPVTSPMSLPQSAETTVHDSNAVVRTPSPTRLAREAACSLAISLTFPFPLCLCVCVLNLLQLPRLYEPIAYFDVFSRVSTVAVNVIFYDPISRVLLTNSTHNSKLTFSEQVLQCRMKKLKKKS